MAGLGSVGKGKPGMRDESHEVVTRPQKRKGHLWRCYAYGHSPVDRDLLRGVGRGHAVNPSRELAAITEKNLASSSTTDGISELHCFEGQA